LTGATLCEKIKPFSEAEIKRIKEEALIHAALQLSVLASLLVEIACQKSWGPRDFVLVSG